MTLAGAASFVYSKLLSPAPLRWLTNKVLLFILPKSVTLQEGVLNLHPQDPVISGALTLGVYEPFQMEVFRSHIKNGDVVLDIGANIGLYTLIAAKHAGETGSVFSFEPEKENFAILMENIRINRLSSVQTVQCAVADLNGSEKLLLCEDNRGNHALATGPDSSEFQVVKTVRMDDWLSEHKIEKVDVIKIDIQGAEPRAFAGMERALRNSRVLFTEYEPAILRAIGSDPVAMLTLLTTIGYQLFEINENTKKIVAIENFAQFTARLSGNSYANILGLNQRKI